MYGLAFLPAALAEWNALDTGIKTQLKKALGTRLNKSGRQERKTPRRFTRVLQN
jgi:mRNA-degrading endonuclease RelE of RelBE toxin-antitoxin system